MRCNMSCLKILRSARPPLTSLSISLSHQNQIMEQIYIIRKQKDKGGRMTPMRWRCAAPTPSASTVSRRETHATHTHDTCFRFDVLLLWNERPSLAGSAASIYLSIYLSIHPSLFYSASTVRGTFCCCTRVRKSPLDLTGYVRDT